MIASAQPTIPPPEKFHNLLWQQALKAKSRMPPSSGHDVEDLYAEGLLVYSRFRLRFDPSRGHQFITGFYLYLWQHLWKIVQQAHRRVPLNQWIDRRTGGDDWEGACLEDLAVDRRPRSVREQIGGDLVQMTKQGLSREAWCVVRAILDPPADFVAWCQTHHGPGRSCLQQVFSWLGYNEPRMRRRIKREIADALKQE